MMWNPTLVIDENEWTEEYGELVISSHARRPLPPSSQRIGSTTATWQEPIPGGYVIHATGGAVDDRRLARAIIAGELDAYGLRPMGFTIGGPELRKTANWDDVQSKAIRLMQNNNVQILRNAPDTVVGHVIGDHGEYQTEISRQDPTSNVIDHWTCLLADAPITLADGTRKPICEIGVGDEVVTHTGSVKRVTQAWAKPYTGSMTRVKMKGMDEEVIATSNHRFWTANEDYHLQRRNGWYGKNRLHVGPLDSQVGWNELGSLKVKDYLSFTPTTHEVEVECAGIKVDADLAYFLGWYTAEGFVVKSSKNRIGLVLNATEWDVAEKLSTIIKNQFGTPGTIRRSTRSDYSEGYATDFRISHPLLRQMVEEFIGTGSFTKKLDRRLMEAPLDIQKAFLQGWYEGDGSWDAYGKRRSLCTVSPELAIQARVIIGRLGFDSSLSWNDDNSGNGFVKNWRRIYRVRWNEERVRADAERFVKDGSVWHRIERVEHFDYQGLVYDIEVEDDHSFQAYSINCHNCECPYDQFAWQRCVIMGTMITMADGTQKPAEDICVGEAIIDHIGAVGIVAEIHSEDWDNDAVTLHTTGFPSLTVKPNHPVWGVESHEIQCKNKDGSLLKKGGVRGPWVGYCPVGHTACRNPREHEVVPTFRLAEEFNVNDFLVRPTFQAEVVKDFLDLTELASEQIVIEDGQIIPTHEMVTRWGVATIAKCRKAALPERIAVNEDFMRLIGYYLAEGGIANYSVRFAFHRKEIEYLEDVRNLAKTIFGNIAKFEGKTENCLSVSMNNREIAAIFRNLVGTGHTTKKIPGWIMRLPVHLQTALLEGWHRGDGHIRKSDGRYELATVSPTLAYQAELLLQRQGYTVGRIRERRSERIGEKNEQDAYKLYWFVDKRANRGVRFTESGNTMVKIEKIERSVYQGKMIDFTIIGNPGYLAEGFSVHNTRQWKPLEGRPCSHVLATHWYAQGVPLDVEHDPTTGQPIAPENQHGQLGLPIMTPSIPSGGTAPPGQPGDSPPASGQLSIPGIDPAAAEQPPTPPPSNIIPSLPTPPIPPPVSVPGAKVPDPTNPIQWSGGTFSSISDTIEDYGREIHITSRSNVETHRDSGWTLAVDGEQSPRWVWSSGVSAPIVAGAPGDIYRVGGTDSRGIDARSQSGLQDTELCESRSLNTDDDEREYDAWQWTNGDQRTEDSLRKRTRVGGVDNQGWTKVPKVSKLQEGSRKIEDATIASEMESRGAVISATGDTFQNSDMVRINKEEYGLAEGKSEEHGAGQYRIVPKNSIGEVLAQDQTTGWVETLFAIHDAGPMEPYFVRCFLEPKDLSLMTKVLKPGPFIRRR